MKVTVDFSAGHISSLTLDGTERIAAPAPLFRLQLRDRDGKSSVFTSYDAKKQTLIENGARYECFDAEDALSNLSVSVWAKEKVDFMEWYVRAEVGSDRYLVEWIDYPTVTLPRLIENDEKGGSILIPYNEGVLISNGDLRESCGFRYQDPVYPSMGSYFIFPNMLSSQMMAYLWKDVGLYIGMHDPKRGVKAIDFYPTENGLTMQTRIFCGVDYGAPYAQDFPIVWRATDGAWESAAECYREWLEANPVPNMKKIVNNPSLPKWYEDAPLVVSYPVRGIHDMDEMKPNALYPYVNALPLIDEIREATDSKILTLLMHWEGTAPWAPPFVWPPFGGADGFEQFRRALHDRGDLLGVYCSGFGYTIQSNLISSYNCEKQYADEGLESGMCAGPDGKVAISKICTGQRSGYDICPASETGRKLLDKAYEPLFASELDYVQILDQNHGGGQYFCYSRDHGHPPAPGAWMTENMQGMLSEWNQKAPKTLFGCESAAAEPFIGNLLFSDNRFELNYKMGVPVPLYAYLYHEYVRNFMGNQVGCPLTTKQDTLRYRLAYSFSIGDCMTLVLTPNGDLMTHWGTRDFENAPNRELTLKMIKNLTRFYKESGKEYLFAGRMIPAPSVECEAITIPQDKPNRQCILPTVHASAWQSSDGRRALILVNPHESDRVCRVDGKEITVPALDAVLKEF